MDKHPKNLREGLIVGNRYQIGRRLEIGGVGDSYLCRDLNEADERLLVKILCPVRSPSPETDSWSRDLSMLCRLRHPGLVRIMDFGLIDGSGELFLVAERIDGRDVYTATEGLDTQEILNVIAELSGTILFLHSQGIVHGNLRPSNAISAESEDGIRQLKILDFGLANFPGCAPARSEHGALAYTAPERLLGGTASVGSDMYALGILIYQLLARRLPFEDDDPGFLAQKHLQGSVNYRPIELLKAGSMLVPLLRILLDKDEAKRSLAGENILRKFCSVSDRSRAEMNGSERESRFSALRLIGREREMLFLQERVRRVQKSRRGWTVFVTGEAGSGKTRCMEELRGWAMLEGWRVVEGSCAGRGDDSYGPYRQILAKTRSVGGKEIFSFGENLHSPETEAFKPSSEYAAGQFRDLLTREIVRRLAECPTVLLLHDFHHADEATLAVLDYLSSDIQAHPILMCVSLRSGEETRGALGKMMDISIRQQRGEMLALEQLAMESIQELVSVMTGNHEIKETLGTWIFRKTGGNPFFLEEMLKHLAEQGVLSRESGRWGFAEEKLGKLEVPAGVAAVLQKRLNQLSPASRKMANWLSLFNRPVSRDFLGAVMSQSAAEALEASEDLVRRQMARMETRENKSAVEFRHALIAEVVRESLPKRRRVGMHRKIAEMLEQEFGTDGHLQELTMHCIKGKLGEKAVRYALVLASQARVEFAHETALLCFEYVFRDRSGLSREELCKFSIEASDSLLALGQPRRAIHLLQTELDKSRNIDLDLKARMLMQLAFSYQHLGDFRMQERCCKRGLSLLGRKFNGRTNLTKAMLYAELAFGSVLQSQPRRGLAFLDKAMEYCPETNAEALAGRIQIFAASLHRVACSLHKALSAGEKAVCILSRYFDSYLSCSAYSTLGTTLMGLGRFSLALEKHKHAVFLSENSRSIIPRSQALGNLAECLCRMGYNEQAESALNRAVRLVSESNNPAIGHAFNTILAEVKLAGNDYRGALKIIDRLAKKPSGNLALYTVGHAYYVAANAFFALGYFDRALKYIDTMRRIENTGAPFYESELAKALKARILMEQGSAPEALGQLIALDKALAQKRWPYQLCIVKLHMAEVLIGLQKLSDAWKHAKNALRLAKAMNSIPLMSYAYLLLGTIHSSANRPGETGSEKESEIPALRAGFSTEEKAVEALQSSYQLIESTGYGEIAWRAHAELCRIFKSQSDMALSLDHAKKAYDCLCRLEDQMPPEMLPVFRGSFNRGQAKAELMGIMAAGQDPHRRTEIPDEGIYDDEKAWILLRMSKTVTTIRDLNPLLEAILDQLIQAMGMERALIFLKDESTGRLQLAKARTNRMESPSDIRTLNQDLLDEVCSRGVPIVSANLQRDPRVLGREPAAAKGSGRLLCAPLKISGLVLGLLYADHSQPAEILSESTINLFAAFCNLSAIALDNAIAHQKLVKEKHELEQYLHQVREEYPEIIGLSPVVEALRDKIALVAASPLDVLITGESGTGKELVARAIHRTCRRSSGKFVPVDCGSLSDSLAEAELFGYRKGAFTGAAENRQGLLESANKGIIFLDEISNLPFQLQAKLLRVLQEREVRRIGETIQRKIDIRVLAATNKDLMEEIRTGRFRSDLYYRLRATEIRVPSLRERLEDIPLLIRFFLGKIAESEGGRSKDFNSEASGLLQQYSYPGNIRELKNIVAEAFYSTTGIVIGAPDLPSEVSRGRISPSQFESDTAAGIYREILEGSGNFENLVRNPFSQHQFSSSVVRGVIQKALQDTGGRYRDALARLRIPDSRYSVTMQFLKRNKCYLDFRAFRRKSS
jgi:Nif-specific regulatory protein